jgi:hypothetical protein
MIKYQLSNTEYEESVKKELSYLDEFLSINRYDLVVTDNVVLFASSLSALDKISYPFSVDTSILETTPEDRRFCLMLYRSDLLIGTYFAKQQNLVSYILNISKYFQSFEFDNFKDYINQFDNYNDAWYSSAQWTHPMFRGNDIGTILDYAKKQLIYSVFNGAHNYCLHHDEQTEYHLKTLGYDISIPTGELVSQDHRITVKKPRGIAISSKENWNAKFPELHSNLKAFKN